MQKNLILLIVLVVVLGGIFYLESRKANRGGGADDGASDLAIDTSASMTLEEKAEQYDVAKEISSPDAFINVDSITIEEELAKGNIVLVDFWTYSCINCQRTLPFLNDWHEKYADEGLTIIGIHTPEFEFEKDVANVEDAVERFEVKHPVVLDNDFSTWRAYENRFWPRKYLIDIDGFIVYDHIGEGAYEETEAKIVELLNEKKQREGEQADLQVDAALPEDAVTVDFSQIGSRETYLGYGRVEYLNNVTDPNCAGQECTYILPDTVPPGTFSLVGDWRIEEERAVLAGDAGSIVINFLASKVNFVAEGISGPVTARLLLDGETISEQDAGLAVTDSVVTFDEPILHELVDLDGRYEEHILEIKLEDAKDFAGFAFTFG